MSWDKFYDIIHVLVVDMEKILDLLLNEFSLLMIMLLSSPKVNQKIWSTNKNLELQQMQRSWNFAYVKIICKNMFEYKISAIFDERYWESQPLDVPPTAFLNTCLYVYSIFQLYVKRGSFLSTPKSLNLDKM